METSSLFEGVFSAGDEKSEQLQGLRFEGQKLLRDYGQDCPHKLQVETNMNRMDK